jgi:hypothetical protein
MSRSSRSPKPLAAAVAAAFLAACAGHTGSSFVPSQVPAAAVAPDAVPPACKGQKTTPKYASLTVKLATKGGSFCIPAIAGFGGAIKYPAANPSVSLALISSAVNYAHLKALGKGKAIFYLQLSISGATTFGASGTAGGGLTGKAIVPGKTYTAFGQASVGGFSVPLTPCFTKATKGKYGGVIGGLGTLLKGQSIPVAATGFLEIYPGTQATGPC